MLMLQLNVNCEVLNVRAFSTAGSIFLCSGQVECCPRLGLGAP
jgi:hypothetical protein